MRTFFAALAAGGMLIAIPARAADDCQLERFASLEMIPETKGRIMVPVRIQGHPMMFAVDTGSGGSMITQAAAQSLGLRIERFTGSRATLWGGTRLTRYVNVSDFTLRRNRVDPTQFYVLPDAYVTPGLDGVLGTDVLRYFDVDFDFANGKLNLFRRYHCHGKVVYWTQDPNVITLKFRTSINAWGSMNPDENQILFYVTIDGHDILAQLDTGSPTNAMNLEKAQAVFGIRPDSPGVQRITSERAGALYRYHFKTLSFDGVTVRNPEFHLDSYDLNKMPRNEPPILIGMNTLRQFHLYISYEERKLFISLADAK